MTPQALQQLHHKEKKLLSVRDELKKEFVGIDPIIDEFIHQIRIWYLMPELLTKPVIINLWGMTGVGKTDLVRRFVSLIEFEPRFVEIELSNTERSAYYRYATSVGEILRKHSLETDEPGIAFFDEIQKFRTIAEDKSDVPTQLFQDFWELLSDGKLAKRGQADELEELLMNLMQDTKMQKYEQSMQKEDTKPRPQYIRNWDLYRLKGVLKAKKKDITIEEMTTLTPESALTTLQESFQTKKVFQVDDFRKLLIIISGNIDEAYDMAKQTQEAEVDADVFAALTSKINIIDIKQALSRRFKPEQVSRFGNIHLIYPSLNRQNFQMLIHDRLGAIQQRVSDQYGITLKIDRSIEELVYVNGVFPVQGVRPVFSAIGDIVESHLAEFLYITLTENFTTINLTYEKSSNCFVVIFSTQENKLKPKMLRTPFTGRIDRIRKNYSHSETFVTAVHEAGHALAYAVAFGLAPVQLKANLASSSSSGFTFPHLIQMTKKFAILKIQVLLAGRVAEELFFGQDYVTTGSQADIEMATVLAADSIRRFGFSDTLSKVVTEYDKDANVYSTDFEKTNDEVEIILKAQRKRIEKVIQAHEPFLRELAEKLAIDLFISPAEFTTIAQKHDVNCRTENESYTISHDYQLKGRS